MRNSRWQLIVAVLVVLAGLLLMVGATNLVESARYQAITSGVQAIGVLVALGLGVATLRGDSNDRRVDRVLTLHADLVSGELQSARIRLIRHLRLCGRDGKFRTVSGFDLEDDPELNHYADDPNVRPRADLNLILRYFERANAVRSAGAVDLTLFADLVGGHALWWDAAVIKDSAWPTRQHLMQLADWLRDYYTSEVRKNPLLSRWPEHVKNDFG